MHFLLHPTRADGDGVNFLRRAEPSRGRRGVERSQESIDTGKKGGGTPTGRRTTPFPEKRIRWNDSRLERSEKRHGIKFIFNYEKILKFFLTYLTLNKLELPGSQIIY